MGAIMMTNSDPISSLDLISIARESLDIVLESKTKTKFVPTQLKEKKLTKEQLDKFSGYYASGMGLVEVKSNSSDLSLDLFGLNLRAIPLEDDTFQIKYKLFGLIALDISFLPYFIDSYLYIMFF